tara:strand:- start:189 stop:317 length:129 start_codon:yes stop_codon:yes gene_type:complete
MYKYDDIVIKKIDRKTNVKRRKIIKEKKNHQTKPTPAFNSSS